MDVCCKLNKLHAEETLSVNISISIHFLEA